MQESERQDSENMQGREQATTQMQLVQGTCKCTEACNAIASREAMRKRQRGMRAKYQHKVRACSIDQENAEEEMPKHHAYSRETKLDAKLRSD